MFAAVQQHFLVLELKRRVPRVLVVCLEGLALSELSMSEHFPCPDLSGLLQASLWVPAGSLQPRETPPGEPTALKITAQVSASGPFLVHRVDAFAPPLLLWPLWGFHQAETSGHLKTKTPSTLVHPKTKKDNQKKSEETQSLNSIFTYLPTGFLRPLCPNTGWLLVLQHERR